MGELLIWICFGKELWGDKNYVEGIIGGDNWWWLIFIIRVLKLYWMVNGIIVIVGFIK